MKKKANTTPIITIGIMYKSIFTGGGVSKPGGGGGVLAKILLLNSKRNIRTV
jgi:hypothetical protein